MTLSSTLTRLAALAALLAALPAHAADGSICLYAKKSYQGASLCVSADTPWIGDSWNDRVSSVRVPAGMQTQLFADVNYGGASVTLTADTPNLGKLGFNDLTSSLRVPASSSCRAVTWAAGTNYPLGTLVRYAASGAYYRAINVTTNGTEGTDPTVSTWFWAPAACLPDNGRLAGGYYPNWTSAPPRIRNLDSHYNLVYLFAAHPVGGPPGTTGAVTFDLPGDGQGAASNLNADIRYARTMQSRKIMLSVGGAGEGMSFPNRTKSQTFVNSIVSIYNQLGGFDGLDWNTFEGSQAPDTSEMIWISKELKRLYPGFIVSAPPAPWNSVDKAFCQAMVAAGAMDYAAPQYYDGPNLNLPSYVVPNVAEWTALLGAAHVVVGFGINTTPNYMSPADAITIWNQVLAANPAIHGGFDWEINTDLAQGLPFALGVAPLIER